VNLEVYIQILMVIDIIIIKCYASRLCMTKVICTFKNQLPEMQEGKLHHLIPLVGYTYQFVNNYEKH